VITPLDLGDAAFNLGVLDVERHDSGAGDSLLFVGDGVRRTDIAPA
jgi:hypothetical protein